LDYESISKEQLLDRIQSLEILTSEFLKRKNRSHNSIMHGQVTLVIGIGRVDRMKLFLIRSLFSFAHP
jgi:hypothetical protein